MVQKSALGERPKRFLSFSFFFFLLTSLYCGFVCGEPWFQNILNQPLSQIQTYDLEVKLEVDSR